MVRTGLLMPTSLSAIQAPAVAPVRPQGRTLARSLPGEDLSRSPASADRLDEAAHASLSARETLTRHCSRRRSQSC